MKPKDCAHRDTDRGQRPDEGSSAAVGIAMTDLRPSYAFVIPWPLGREGGVNQVVLNLLHQCRRSGRFRPLLIENIWQRREPFEFTRLGYHAIQLQMRQPMVNGTVREMLSYMAFLPSEMRRLLRVLKSHRVEVFNTHFACIDPFTIVLLKKLRLWRGKLLISLHGSDVRLALRSPWAVRYLTKWVFRNADAIVPCSNNLLQATLKLDPYLTNCHAIPNGVDTSDFLGSEPVALRDPGTEMIVSIGRFERKKGHDTLIAAFRKVASKRPQARLWIIGEEGDSMARIRTLTEGDMRIRLFVNVPHGRAMATIAHADIFALSSRIEPFGIALLEAAHFGLPVVSTRCGGPEEIIPDDAFGRLVSVDDIPELAAAMEGLLEDRTEAREMGERLRKRVAANFSWEETWRQYEGLV